MGERERERERESARERMTSPLACRPKGTSANEKGAGSHVLLTQDIPEQQG